MITHCSPDDVPLHVAQIYPKPIARVLYEHPENSSASQSRKIPSISNLVFYVPFRFLNIFTCRGLRRASPNIAFLGDNLDYGSLWAPDTPLGCPHYRDGNPTLNFSAYQVVNFLPLWCEAT